MKQDEALAVIKQILDAATKRGIFEDINSAAVALTAFNTITEALKPKEPTAQ
jgi:hypothetical protein